jgi:hypothetical protein
MSSSTTYGGGVPAFAFCWEGVLKARYPLHLQFSGIRAATIFYLANYEEAVKYFHVLAASSDRMKMFTVGKTSQGRDIEVAVISSPENPGSAGRVQKDSAATGDSRRPER